MRLRHHLFTHYSEKGPEGCFVGKIVPSSVCQAFYIKAAGGDTHLILSLNKKFSLLTLCDELATLASQVEFGVGAKPVDLILCKGKRGIV